MKTTIARPILLITAMLVVTATLLQASDQVPAAKQKRPVALVGGTVHTVSGDVITGGTVVFADGKITAIGKNVDVPAGAEKIDVSGKHVYPGLIASNTSIGLVEINAVRATRDMSEVGGIKPNVRAEVSVNPDSEIIPVTRANGITMALTIPQGGTIQGTSALLAMDGWTWEDMTFKAPVAMHLTWPSMTVNTAWWERRSPEDQIKDRDKAIKRIKDTFKAARAYMKAKEAETATGVPYHDTDLRWDAMIPVLKKEVPVFIHAYDISTIQAAVDWSSTEDIRVVLLGGYDADKVTGLLKEKNIPVIIAGTHRTPLRRYEDYDAPYKLPLRLHEAGVQFCIATSGGSFGTAHERNLPYHAAMAAAYGLPKEEALKAVTLYPAQIMGVDDRVGSLEVGKDATLIVTDGDPLEIMTNVVMEFIGGKNIDLTSRHTMLYDKYKKKYEQIDAEKKGSAESP